MFDGSYYMQTCGASMGAKFPPSMGNVFLRWWEECFLFTHPNPFARYLHWFGRYIDNLLAIWEGDTRKLEDFVGYLNNKDLNLQCTPNFHATCRCHFTEQFGQQDQLIQLLSQIVCGEH